MDARVEHRIRVVLVGDQTLFLSSLGRFLTLQDLEVVGECSTASEALAILNASPVDVTLVDLDLRVGGADDLIPAALEAGYKGRFLGIAGAAGADALAAAIKTGASGIFLKTDRLDRLVQAIRMVASGAVRIDRKVIQLLADRVANGSEPSEKALTDREERVLVGIIGGLTNRKIGKNLGLAEGTVKGVVQQLFSKAGVHSRSQLVRTALEGSFGGISGFRKLAPEPSRGGPSEGRH